MQIPPLDIIQKFVSEIDYKIDNNNPSSGLFRVKFEDADRVGSYNYTDLFTRSVEVSMYNGETYEPLVQPQLEVKKTRVSQQPVIENS